jgi:alkanesulfonate monooxygenase SsuD/methylene tetrahydromethanopterin reductase-like flavin-dependent oxidoreductase (luciferase family)
VTALGLFVDLRHLGTAGRSTTDHMARTIELVAGAEGLGAGSVWFTEHHGFADGYLPQPLVLAAAVAARTSRVRLGTAVVLAPLRHPRHLAEEAALVDQISGGRLQLGLGAGYAPAEYAMFGLDMGGRFGRTDATAAEVVRLLASGTVTPAPAQDPLPVWLGYQGPQGARRAGQLGVGLLSVDRALLEPYQAGLVAGGHDPSSARMGGLVDIIVADDPESARARLFPHWVHQQDTYRALRRGQDGQPPPVDVDAARAALERTGRLGNLQVLDADGAVAVLRERLAGVPAEHVYAWLTLADMPDDLVERHIELWCGPVREALEQPG